MIIAVQVVAFFLVWANSPFACLPSLGETLHSLKELWFDGLGIDIGTSFAINIEAIAWSCVVSLGLTYLTVIPFFRPPIVFLGKLRFLSLVGLTFFFTVATKSGHALKLDLLIFSISVFFITSMLDVLNSIPKTQYDLARTLRMGSLRIVWEVIVLGQLDKVFDVLRQNAAIGWMTLTMVEGMVRSEGGIGASLLDQNKHFHLPAILAIQLVILMVGLAQDYGIGMMRKIFCPYADLSLERK
jgi:NitT/TauT family transport system permease protein